MLALLLAAAVAADTACVRATTVVTTPTRADTVQVARCIAPRVDTVRVVTTDTIVRTDTVTVVRTDTLWRERPDSTPRDTIPTDPPPTDTAPPPPPPPPPPPSGVAELPRAVPTWPAALATAGCTVTVTANLQGALGAARAGDVLCLSGVFRGNFTLPARGDSGWVVVRSLLSPVTPGQRVRPSQRADLAMIVASGTLPAITTAPGARGWYVREVEIATDSALSTMTYALIDFAAPSSVATFARDLVLDRVYAHGWPHRPLVRCVSLQSASTAILNSWLDECHAKGTDSQAIAGWSGPGPYLIENNTLAGAGENVMFGGADPRFRGVHPADITIQRNHVVTPAAWRGVWTKKNLLEFKNAARVLVEGNVFEGSWADGQTGYALVIKSTNQGCGCPDCGSRDVTVRRNLVVRAGAALTINGKDTNNCSNGGTARLDSLTRRVAVVENLSDSLGTWTLDNRGVSFYTNASDVLLRRNSWLAPPTKVNAYTADAGGTGAGATRLTIDGDVLAWPAYWLAGCFTTCTPALSFRAAVIGSGAIPTHARAFQPVASLDAALAAGYGVSRATIDTATRGVVVPR